MSNIKAKINLVMFNMSSYAEWERGVQNRNYHILRGLLNDDRVGRIVAVDYLPHTLKRAVRNYQENLLSRPLGKVLKKSLLTRAVSVNERLTVYSSVWPIFSQAKFYAGLRRFLQEQGLSDYVVWSYYPLTVGYLKELKGRLIVFDAVDNWSEHSSYKKQASVLKKNYRTIDDRADLIFTVSQELESLFENKDHVHWFPNGVDLKHYQQEYPIINRDIGNLSRPVIGYVGTIQDRLDLDLFEYLARQNPDKSFALVGPVWYKRILEKLQKFPNVHFLGRKSYEEIPMYIQQFDAGIIPHKIDRFIRFTNPMKMYEYLACGKPVVSTSGAGVDLFSEQLYITNDFKQFNLYLNQALKDKDERAVKERLEAIKEHSWLKRVDKMLDLIEQKL